MRVQTGPTRGRVRPTGDILRMETVVTTTPPALRAPLGFEHAHIVQLCRRPMSLAELAAALDVPIGTAQELVADLICDGLLVVHAQVYGDQPSVELLVRLHQGMRHL